MNKTKFLAGLLAAMMATTALAVPVVLDILFDDLPEETGFGIWTDAADVNNGDIYASIPFNVALSSNIGLGDGFAFPGDFDGADNGPWQFIWDLAPGDYYFAIFDAFGDGICCDFGVGEYTLSAGGAEVFSGGDFFDIDPVSDNGEYMGLFTVDEIAVAVAEPSTLTLLGLGMIGVALLRRRR